MRCAPAGTLIVRCVQMVSPEIDAGFRPSMLTVRLSPDCDETLQRKVKVPGPCRVVIKTELWLSPIGPLVAMSIPSKAAALSFSDSHGTLPPVSQLQPS